MAHYDDNTVKALLKDAKDPDFQRALPGDLFYEVTDPNGPLEVLAGLQGLDQWPQSVETERRRDQRDEYAARVDVLLNSYHEHLESLPFDPGAVKMRRGWGPNVRGDHGEDIVYEGGFTERIIEDREVMAKAKAQSKAAADELAAITDLFQDASDYAAAARTFPSDTDVSKDFWNRSHAAREEATTRRTAYRKDRVAQLLEAGFSDAEARKMVTGRDGEFPIKLSEGLPFYGQEHQRELDRQNAEES